MPFGTEDGVVCTEVEVICGGIQGQLLLGRNPGEVVSLRGCGDLYGAELLCFLHGIACEVAGNSIVSLAGYHQVQWDCGELHGSAALHKQDLIVIRDIHDTAQHILCTVDDIIVVFGSVTHLHDGHAGAFIVKHLCCGFFQNRQRHHGRTCRKVVNSSIGHENRTCLSKYAGEPVCVREPLTVSDSHY